ncbi:MAG: hypothetical protein RIQ33_905 [Bacteroidota bacterium]|jgi:hypothetical protein
MYKINVVIIAIALLLLNSKKTDAQGCSDAGFCSIVNHNKPTIGDSINKKMIHKIGVGYGLGEGTTHTFGIYYSNTLKIATNTFWNNKIVAQYATGNLGNNLNLSDLLSSISYNHSINKTKFTFIGGVKIPLNNSAAMYLPMPYQSSLGTFDAIGGVNYSYKKIFLQSAFQIPIINFNKNTYLQNKLIDTTFSSTNGFIRKPDVLLRMGYLIGEKNKWKFTPNILAIYHLQNDSYLNLKSEKITLIGSEGLTLNFNLISTYKISATKQIEFSLASPLVVRKIRPDGLTRAITLGVEYQF